MAKSRYFFMHKAYFFSCSWDSAIILHICDLKVQTLSQKRIQSSLVLFLSSFPTVARLIHWNRVVRLSGGSSRTGRCYRCQCQGLRHLQHNFTLTAACSLSQTHCRNRLSGWALEFTRQSCIFLITLEKKWIKIKVSLAQRRGI